MHLLPRVGVAPLAVWLLFLPGPALARPCGGASVDVALREATLVVKGWFEYTRTEDVPPPPGSDLASVIRVDRVLKGATSQTRIAVTHFLCGFENRIAMRTDRPLIAFVTGSGGLVRGTAVLPASQFTAAEISDDPTANLRAELLLGATDSDPIVVRAALGALAELDGDASSAILKQSIEHPDLGVRVRALTWLTQFGDVAAFHQLAQTLSAWPFTPFAIPTLIGGDEEISLVIAYDDVSRALISIAVRDFDFSTPSPFHTPDASILPGEALRHSLHWAFPQAYYAVFALTLAYFKTVGFTEDSHASVIRKVGTEMQVEHYPPTLSFLALGGKHRTYLHLDACSLLTPYQLYADSPGVTDAQVTDTHVARFLNATRGLDVTTRLKTLNLKTVGGKKKSRFTSTEWERASNKLGPTSLLSLLYRKRIKAHYQDIDTFLHPELDAGRVFNALGRCVAAMNFVHEAYIARAVGIRSFETWCGRLAEAARPAVARRLVAIRGLP